MTTMHVLLFSAAVLACVVANDAGILATEFIYSIAVLIVIKIMTMMVSE